MSNQATDQYNFRPMSRKGKETEDARTYMQRKGPSRNDEAFVLAYIPSPAKGGRLQRSVVGEYRQLQRTIRAFNPGVW
jgi:hypothetical protein